MLTFHDGTASSSKNAPDLSAAALPPRVVWVDILNGSAEEIAFIERATRLTMPTRAELSEIESSSRLRAEDGVLCLSAPLLNVESGAADVAPVGFILTKDLLITIRFTPLKSFASFGQQIARPGPSGSCSAGAFAGLMDAIIDRLADILEQVGSELDMISRRVFRINTDAPATVQRPAHASADLREVLHRIGRSGDLASKIRDSLLGIGRIVPYVANMSADWFPAELKSRLETQRHDIASLSDYDMHLTNKVQLLLDAVLGLINIEQNNIIKVLTVVSVVGVPPTLVASMYGMNFHNMPELSWAWGYPYGLALIALSAILPLAWFKFRGWM